MNMKKQKTMETPILDLFEKIMVHLLF